MWGGGRGSVKFCRYLYSLAKLFTLSLKLRAKQPKAAFHRIGCYSVDGPYIFSVAKECPGHEDGMSCRFSPLVVLLALLL